MFSNYKIIFAVFEHFIIIEKINNFRDLIGKQIFLKSNKYILFNETFLKLVWFFLIIYKISILYDPNYCFH